MRKITKIILLASMAITSLGKAEVYRGDRKTNVSYEEMSEILLKFYSLTDAEIEHARRASSNFNEMMREIQRRKNEVEKKKVIDFGNLTEFQMMSATAKAMKTLRAYRSDSHLVHSVLPTMNDLGFFEVKSALFKKIDRTMTMPGKLVLASMIANPLVERSEIEKRKEFLQFLTDKDTQLVKQLRDLLNEFAENQREIYSYWDVDPAVAAMIDDKLYSGFMADSDSSMKLGMNYYLRSGAMRFSAGALAGLAATFTGGCLLNTYKSSVGGEKPIDGEEVVDLPQQGPKQFCNGDTKAILNAAQAAALTTGVFAHFSGNSNDSVRRELFHYVHKRGIAMASLFKTASKFQQLLEKEPRLASALKNSDTFRKILEDSDGFDKRFVAIRKLLTDDPTFNKNSYQGWFTSVGKVLYADYQVRLVLDDFAELFETIGELDAYVSIIQIYNEFAKAPVKYSLVTALSEREPTLRLKGFWHPMIDPNKVVTNSIDKADGLRGMILTGSNTAGKSTTLKAMLLSALLGQGLGIAPAESAELTPFAFIGTFMNISDNIGEKASLFQAEVDRARKLISEAKDVARLETFGIVAMDELFTGTNPEDGAKGTDRVARKLFINPNLITLFATHYANMTTLPDDPEFQGQVMNYYIDAERNNKGRYVHNYKLMPGISTVRMADYLFDRDL